MWLTIDEVLSNYSVISPKRVTLLDHCTFSHCARPFNEVSLNSKHWFLSYAPQGKGTKGNNSTNTEDGVMVIVHCTFAHCA
jgi:hypothetical protein